MERRRLWWDDHWAFCAFIADAIYFVSMLAKPSTTDYSVSNRRRIVHYWMSAIPPPVIVCCARISIAMSISRILPPRTATRRLLFAVSVLFALVGLSLLVQKVWVCCSNKSWHHNPAVQCYLGSTIGIISLITDIIGDTFLVVVPLQILWRVRLPKSQRTLIIAIFASSILSSATGVVYAYFVFISDSLRGSSRGLIIGLTSQVKATITLCVCNLLVVVCYFYRVFRNGRDIELEAETIESGCKPPTSQIPSTPISTLTTISGIDNSQLDPSLHTLTTDTHYLSAPSTQPTSEPRTSVN
ncbi:hypothetical protein BD779DRAFT_1231137 [Infundibulicybe gibba]|nr:hypothetical protein BD779DRAFT_1231137 [Infundibulicybe gibba]